MFRIISKLKNKRGFTLIELIVVLAVLAIIIAIAVPRFVGVRDQAKLDADYSTGALIAKTVELYTARGLTTITQFRTELVKDFPGGPNFQSDDIKGQDFDDVNITIDSDDKVSEITVDKTGSGSGTVKIFPKP